MKVTPIQVLARDLQAEFERDGEGKRVASILSRYVSGNDDWRDMALFSEDSYARNLVERSDLFELLILCWHAEQESPIHDHGGQKCWMGVLEGSIEEVLYEPPADGARCPLRVRSVRTYTRGQVGFISDEIGLHLIRPSGGRSGICLHLYSRPIPECRVFDPDTGMIRRKKLVYDSIRGERCE